VFGGVFDGVINGGDQRGAVQQESVYYAPESTAGKPMIEVSNLTKRYGDFTAVNDLSFRLGPGEVMGLVGPNGAGKTTTLRCLTGIIPATLGSSRICGIDVAADPVGAKRQLAFIPDEPRLFEYLTVAQHLNFVARLYGVADYAERMQPILAELEMADKRDLLPAELSRGMKQKLAIACGLLHQPRVVIFDEPMTGLDPVGMRRMKGVMRRLAKDGVAIILSSHLLGLVEEVCTHLLILKDGVKMADGTVEEVRARFGEHPDSSLEDVFFRATGEVEGSQQS
jgi:ABC-2 type transport system ATP-binding protein